ncbi:hypothetical protein BIY23_01670 [Wolbachia pipientis]|uniref:Uncharacterized protein n=1 Tax=Wolbachia pipientis TaxID=955 RepID=A0A1E7QL16_WOLPI|nr:hypothetical protein [Wolbachia pipientis]OEY87165.1 hypothetical protein BIY23_01670 [Wolbachia pipientis]
MNAKFDILDAEHKKIADKTIFYNVSNYNVSNSHAGDSSVIDISSKVSLKIEGMIMDKVCHILDLKCHIPSIMEIQQNLDKFIKNLVQNT